MKKLTYILMLLLICSVAIADSGPRTKFQEEDGTPTGRPSTLKVTNGTLTDNGDGTFSLAVGGGGTAIWVTDGVVISPDSTYTGFPVSCDSLSADSLLQCTTLNARGDVLVHSGMVSTDALSSDIAYINGILYPIDGPADDDVIKYDAALGILNFEAGGGGSSIWVYDGNVISPDPATYLGVPISADSISVDGVAQCGTLNVLNKAIINGSSSNNQITFTASPANIEPGEGTLAVMGILSVDSNVTVSGDIYVTNGMVSADAVSTDVLYVAGVLYTPGGGGSVAGANTQVQYNNSGAFGADAGFTFIVGELDVAVSGDIQVAGDDMLRRVAGATDSIVVGNGGNALASGGTENTIIGNNAGQDLSTSDNCTYVGSDAGKEATGTSNTALGALAYTGVNGTTNGANNTSIGYLAGNDATSMASNTLIGSEAGPRVTSGGNNTFIGYGSGNDVTTLGGSTYIGSLAGLQNTAASNTGVGSEALEGVNGSSTGSSNTAIGNKSLEVLTTGIGNTGIGVSDGDTITDGDYNTCIGYASDVDDGSANNAVAIGNASIASSDTCVIGAVGTPLPLEIWEKSSDPLRPAEGQAATWMSDGTGLGDAGDVLMASTTGGVTTYTIIHDHSGGVNW